MSKSDVIPCRTWLFVLVFVAAAPVWAAAAEPKIDAQSAKTLGAMSDFYANATTLAVQLDVSAAVTPKGQPTQTSSATLDYQIKRPAQYLVKLKSDNESATAASDGKTATTYLTDTKKYTTHPVDPATVYQTPMMGMLINGALVSDNPLEMMKKDLTSATYVGKETVNGVEAHHIKLVDAEGDVDLWIDAGDQPLVRQAKVDQSRGMAAAGHPASVIVNIDFKNWQVGQPIADSVFQFTPPAGAQKVDSFNPQTQSESSLKGKPAPDFELTDLDGNGVKLSDLRGKVVILDFWATWCGPCRIGMPIVNKVAGEFADQGVVMYAVNLREPVDRVKPFVQKLPFKLNVLLDTDGSVARQYEIRAIPRTLVIDRKGVVRADHSGVSEDTERELTSEVKSIVETK